MTVISCTHVYIYKNTLFRAFWHLKNQVEVREMILQIMAIININTSSPVVKVWVSLVRIQHLLQNQYHQVTLIPRHLIPYGKMLHVHVNEARRKKPVNKTGKNCKFSLCNSWHELHNVKCTL